MNSIINFHVVSDPCWFERILLVLKSKYQMVSADRIADFLSGNDQSNNLCHITVDDGDISFYKNIYPVLIKHKVPATLFVSPKICEEKRNFWFQEMMGYDPVQLKLIFTDVSGIPYSSIKEYTVETILKSQPINQILAIIKRYQIITNTPVKQPQNMSVGQLIEVSKSNLVSVGAHTINHPILKNENDINSSYEISESVNHLSNILQTKIKYFAYPNGIRHFDFSEREEATLSEAGIQLAFTTEARNLLLSDARFRVPRICISDGESMLYFKAKLLMGARWYSFKRLRKNGEYQQRSRLKALQKNLKPANVV